MKIKDNVRVFMKVIEGKSKRFIMKYQRDLKKMGAIILAVITLSGSIIIVFKMKGQEKINNKPAEII